MEHSDRQLQCAACGSAFVFTAGEQSWFTQNGLQNPRRCKPCRAQGRSQKPRSDAQPGSGGQSPRRGPRPGGERGRAPFADGNGNGNAAGGVRFGARLPSPDDPNGYRAPGFQSETRSAYVIDYSGLPRDEDDHAPAPGNSRDAEHVDRFGMRTDAPAARGPRGPRGPRAAGGGAPGRRLDRSGTDPNAYRSPGFGSSDPAAPRARAEQPSRRKSARAQNALHDAQCGDCGVEARVPFPPGPDRPAFCKTCYQARKLAGTAPIPPRRTPAPLEAPPTVAAPVAAPIAD